MRLDRNAKAWVGAVALFLTGTLLTIAPAARGEQSNITSTTPKTLFSAQAVSASGTATSDIFPVLEKTIYQSVQLRGVGTSPNFKLEALVTVDGTNYVKPETGGDLGTFTDQNYHIVALHLPLCIGLKLKATEIGGSNAVAVDAMIRSQ